MSFIPRAPVSKCRRRFFVCCRRPAVKASAGRRRSVALQCTFCAAHHDNPTGDATTPFAESDGAAAPV
jgi:hypothetical protein